jgi:hypothetical protein
MLFLLPEGIDKLFLPLAAVAYIIYLSPSSELLRLTVSRQTSIRLLHSVLLGLSPANAHCLPSPNHHLLPYTGPHPPAIDSEGLPVRAMRHLCQQDWAAAAAAKVAKQLALALTCISHIGQSYADGGVQTENEPWEWWA